MAKVWNTSAPMSSTLTDMCTDVFQPDRTAFARWLQSRISEKGWTQREAAQRLGVSHPTVGRWLKGRRPEAVYLEKIADVFVTDYDYVATLAGIRPPELMDETADPAGDRARLMDKLSKLFLEESRVRTLDIMLDGWLEDDFRDGRRGHHK